MDLLKTTHRILGYGLGGFWLLDGIFQLQPRMFSADLVTAVMQPSAWHQPPFVTHSMDWMLNLLLSHQVALFNWFIAGLQISIGLLLLTGLGKKSGRCALWLSIGWGSLVWYFGEGLGTLFTGQATYLTGSPGAVLLYVIIAGFLLASQPISRNGGTERMALRAWRRIMATFWVFGALLQCFPAFWAPSGLSVQFYGAAVMTPKSWVTQPIYTMARLSLSHVSLWNLAFVLAMLSLAWGIWRNWGIWFYGWSALWLLFIFWIGENLGMVLSGITTDLNTAPLLALMMYPLYLDTRAQTTRSRRSRVGIAPASAIRLDAENPPPETRVE